MSIQNITIVGTGTVGAALARNLVRHGVQVQLATRDLAKGKELATSLGAAVSVVETRAVRSTGAVLLAVPAAAALTVLEDAAELSPGTIVVDCTNPVKWDNGPVHAAPAEGSVTAQLAKRFPRLRFVKAFNTFGAEFHEDPRLGSASADLYLAGDDAPARQAVGALAQTMGFEPVDVGPLRNAQHLESLAILWIHLATVGGRGRNVAFKLLNR
jgi:predicted dinucleotide-binding enzyme